MVSTISIFAQHAVNGVVRDSSGAVIANATVRLESTAGNLIDRNNTDAGGRFVFNRVVPTRLVLVAEARDFERAVKTLTGAEQSKDLEIVLSPASIAQQVTVTSTGFLEDLDDSTRAATVIGRNELDRRLEFSVAEALRETPGIRVAQLGGPGTPATIRIRGLRNQDTAILFDGMRFRDPAATQGDGSAFVQDMLTLNISRLEALRGCGSSLYGSNAIGGVVNILTDTGGGKFRGDLLAEGGGLGFFRSQLRLGGGTEQNRLNYSLGLGHLNVMEGVDGDDRARNTGGQGFLQFRPTDTIVLSSRLSLANTFLGLNLSPALTSNAPRSGFVTAIPLSPEETAKRQAGLPFTLGNATVFPAANDPDSRRASWFTSALFAMDHQLSPRLNYRAAYQLVDTRRKFPNGPGGIGFQPLIYDESRFDGRIDTAQIRVNHTGNRNLLSGGAEWEREAFDNGGLTLAANPAANSSYRAQVSQRAMAVFAEDRIRLLASKLQITLSGRAQTFDLRRPVVSGNLPAYLTAPVPSPPNAFTGDASVMYRFEKTNTKLRAHVGNAFRAPSLYERYGTGFFGGVFTPYGDPRLAPERSLGGDAGIDQYFSGRRLRLSATYFYTELRTVVGFDFSGLVNRTTDPFGRSSGYFNTNGGLARGVEFEAQAALWRGFQITGSYTHTRTLERRAVAAGTLKTPRIYEHTVGIAATQTMRRFTFTANFLGSPEFIGVISGRAVFWEGPKRLDATASYRLKTGERFKPEIFGRFENLLGQTYYEDGYRTPGRWAVAGLRVSF
jgi:iron complex outermembrane receptor protein